MNLRGGDWTADFPIGSRHTWFSWLRNKRVQRFAIAIVAGVTIVTALALEVRNSWIESGVFREADRHLSYRLAEGKSASIQFPGDGPYDWTLGYSRIPAFLPHLEANGYRIEAQAHSSELLASFSRIGLYPTYPQKDRAGLQILDRDERDMYSFDRPERAYSSYSSIPPLVVQTLLFIENRHMLDSKHPTRNPAVEWDRLGKAFIDYSLHKVDSKHSVVGGSTLATQLEKLRHSPGGRTSSPVDKLRQMTSATLAAYQDGRTTLHAQQDIIRGYINSIPLAASPGYGDVQGLGDGLWVWYGADVSKIDPLLSAPEASLSEPEMQMRARGYRETLSLLLALRSPHIYLVEDPKSLEKQTDRYLRALAERGVISNRLRDLALEETIHPMKRAPAHSAIDYVDNKAPNTIRMSLLPLLGLNNTYDLDRLDLSVQTTMDQAAQQGVTKFFEQIADPKQAAAANLTQYQLLEQNDPSKVIYSLTLYERKPGANLLRVQTDNVNQPLNINQNTRLELGSTAKLRTLINYLEIVALLHQQYAGKSAAELKALPILPDDHLTAWAVQYLSSTQDRSENAMLQAALDRKYSGNPGEAFYTGGGVHVFENFEKSENYENFTVASGFQNSVNLVFIRLMRDIVNYYRYRVPGANPAVLDDWDNPARQKYLARFADEEGKVYLSRFYAKYRSQTSDEALEEMASQVHLTPLRAAVIYRSVRPASGPEEFTAFLKRHFPAAVLVKKNDPSQLYEKYGPDKFNLADRGYLAHIHPLELWMLNYREEHPQANFKELAAQSTQLRQDVYWWLFRSHYKHQQDIRIRTLTEQDAFRQIHKAWKRQGYPFDSLVPSYATTIGVSGDTPAALADLMGILVNNGVRNPNIRIQRLHFGANTPTETVVARETEPGQQVIAPEIAALVRQQLIGVVENGTGRRAHGGIVMAGGRMIPVGGKTGTGDNRLESFSANGRVIGDKAVSRTATFVFMIGDRFYGTIVAFVPGSKAASYKFTSALAVQIFKDLTPQLKPLIDQQDPKIPLPASLFSKNERPKMVSSIQR
ncbi:MAG TPA: transglycosylase domain-containing protein [Bryobacteraceae bacterium]|nr:transglycosylase domain-containing protein [Bryobacteraceae bacterium]